MTIRLPQNPGIGGLDELTSAEELFIQNLAGLTYTQGDILYHNGTNLVVLNAGTSGQLLKTNGAGANPTWISASGTGDFLADGTVPMTGDLNLDGSNLDNGGVVFLIEQAAADADVAGSGQLWVKTATPNELWFTDDAGTDTQLGVGGGGTGDLLADGTIPLTANWDVGAFTITGTQFISDIATGTAPLVVTSTTEVANLKSATSGNADTVTTNANLTGHITSTGNASILGSFTVAQLSTALSDATLSGNNSGDEASASLTTSGIIEIATVTETNTGTDATRSISPAGLAGWTGDTSVITLGTVTTGNADAIVSAASLTLAGKVELATVAETNTGTDATRAVTPAGLTAWTGDTAIVTTGALNAGSITSGFGAIDNGSSNITTTGIGAFRNITLGVDGTITALTLTEKASIALDPAGGADGDYSGITFTATAGETFAFGDVVYLKASDSRWYLADASVVATSGTVAVAFAVTSGASAGACTLMLSGIIRADAGFPALTIGAPVYISITGTTTNTVSVTAPTATDEVVKIVGYALTADEVLVQISPDHLTIV